MLTVIIYKKSSQIFLDKYRTLFEPYISSGKIAFCFWDENGKDFEHALPGIDKIVRGEKQWRAIVVIPPCNQIEERLKEEKLKEDKSEVLKQEEEFRKENPFDYLINNDPEPEVSESPIPLIRLAQMLGGVPLPNRHYETRLVKDEDELSESEGSAIKLDVRRREKDEYLKKQQELWDALDDKYSLKCSRPSRLYLFRARELKEINVPSVMDKEFLNRHETDSSMFWYRNRYPACARFLVQDCVRANHARFNEDLFRFWMTAITLALNIEPTGTFEAYKLYHVNCKLDTDSLKRAFSEYYNRLNDVRFAADKQISILQKEASLNPDSGDIPEYKHDIPVQFEFFEDKDVMISSRRIGLAGDCPRKEEPWWYHAVDRSRKAMTKVFNSTRIVLDKASTLCRISSTMTDYEIHEIDEYKMAELQDQLFDLEQDILTFSIFKVIPLKKYERDLERAKKSCATSMRKRMTSKLTIIAGLICMAVYFLGFLPDIVFQFLRGDSMGYLILIILMGALILLIGSMGCLYHFRSIIRNKIWDYNGIVGNFISDLSDSGQKFGEYLSKCCTYMRGNYMLQSLLKRTIVSTEGITMYREHARHLVSQMDVIKEWMLDFDSDILPERMGDSRYISFDFGIPPKLNPDYYIRLDRFKLDIPFSDGSICLAPYPFIKSYEVRRVPVFDGSFVNEEEENGEVNADV